MLPLALPVVEVDLAKSMFQRAGANGSSRVVESHRLTPIHLERWFVNRAARLTGSVCLAGGPYTPG